MGVKEIDGIDPMTRFQWMMIRLQAFLVYRLLLAMGQTVEIDHQETK